MPDPDFSAFPLRAKGRQFEDFREGQVFNPQWGHR